MAAIVPIVAAGAVVYATDLSVDLYVGSLLALGTILGVPLGTRLLARSSEGALKIAFGILQLVIGVSLVWP